MVVEPDILVRMVIADHLRDCGYKVIEASAAEDVYTVLRADIKIGVVFAEVRLLGRSDGFGLAKELRKTRPDIDVILTSGIANAAEKSSDLCEEGTVKKPYQPEEIIRRINVLRGRRRSSKAP